MSLLTELAAFSGRGFYKQAAPLGLVTDIGRATFRLAGGGPGLIYGAGRGVPAPPRTATGPPVAALRNTRWPGGVHLRHRL